MHYIISTAVLEFLFYKNVTDQMKKAIAKRHQSNDTQRTC